MSVIKCVHAGAYGSVDGMCRPGCECQPIMNGWQCPRMESNGLIRYFNPAKDIVIVWSIDDVKQERPHLTDEQAFEVLEEVSDSHDSEFGVCWETLRSTADILYPKPDGDDLEDNSDDS